MFKRFRLGLLPPKVDLALNLAKHVFVLGENVEGVIEVKPREDFECDEIRCELRCVESVLVTKTAYDEEVGAELKKRSEKPASHSAKPKLAGRLKLAKGRVYRYPFSIPIPLSAPPSTRRADRAVTWSLKRVVAVKRRLDATSRALKIQVVKTSQVAVKCQKCGALNPVHAKFCVNYGAPLR